MPASILIRPSLLKSVSVSAVVMESLERHGFVQKDAAAWLRISRRKLNYMIQRMGVTHPSWRRNRDGATD